MGAADYDTSTWFNGKTAIFIGIKQAPGANPLSVAGRVPRAARRSGRFISPDGGPRGPSINCSAPVTVGVGFR